jgi:hypothetical protein
MLVEDIDEAIGRVGGEREITEAEFTTARDQFATADTVRLMFAQAMMGNFDWCLRMSAGDGYRCNARHPLWNVAVADVKGDKDIPLIYDFDLAGMVAGRHPWFNTVFNGGFVPNSPWAVEVIAQVQRVRALFTRSELDAARREFVARKDDVYRVVESPSLDPDGRTIARRYLDSFYEAIESDDAFYRPVVVAPTIEAYASADGDPICGILSTVPQGTPVGEPLQTVGQRVQVIVLDAHWHWAPPAKCDPVHRGPVWIDASAISREFPVQQP